MACNPGIVYMVVSLLLFAVALVIHFHSSHLSLPIANALTIITAILPIASFINAFVYPNLLAEVSSPNRLQRMSPVVLQGLQVVLTAVLATLYAEGFVPSPALECVLEDVWATLYSSHDGMAIKYIQDTLNCCGLNTVKDRAYPFQGQNPSNCAELYGRSAACRAPWESAMQLHSGINFGVVVVVAIMQIFGLLMMQRGTNWWTTMRDELDFMQPLLAGQDVESGSTAEVTSYGSADGEEGQQEGTDTPPAAR